MDDHWYKENLNCYNKIAYVSASTAYELHMEQIVCDQLQQQVQKLKDEYEKAESQYERKQLKYDSSLQMEKMLSDNIQKTEELIKAKEVAIAAQRRQLDMRQTSKDKMENILLKYDQKFRKITNETLEYCERLPLARKRKHLQNKLLRGKIAVAMLRNSYNDLVQKRKLIKEIDERRQQLVFVKFSRMLLEYREMEQMERNLRSYQANFGRTNKEITPSNQGGHLIKNIVISPPISSNDSDTFQTLMVLSPINFDDISVTRPTLISSNPTDFTSKSRNTIPKRYELKRSSNNDAGHIAKKRMFEKQNAPEPNSLYSIRKSTGEAQHNVVNVIEKNCVAPLGLKPSEPCSNDKKLPNGTTGNTQILEDLSLEEPDVAGDKEGERDLAYKEERVLQTVLRQTSEAQRPTKPAHLDQTAAKVSHYFKENQSTLASIPEIPQTIHDALNHSMQEMPNTNASSAENSEYLMDVDNTGMQYDENEMEYDVIQQYDLESGSGEFLSPESVQTYTDYQPASSFVLSSPPSSPSPLSPLQEIANSPNNVPESSKPMFSIFGGEKPKESYSSPFSFSFGEQKSKSSNFFNMF